MPTKEAQEKELNEILGTDIEWSRLLQDDLENFKGQVESGIIMESVVKHQVEKKGKEAVEEQIDSWYPGKVIGGLL